MKKILLSMVVFVACDKELVSFDTSSDDGLTHVDESAEDTAEPSEEEEPIVDPPPVVRFIALGDAGTGEDGQYQVAEGIETVCAAKGCDFALYLGDNIYSSGVSGTDDDQFIEKFENPYANLDFPFFAVLGNHDYGALGAGILPWKGDYQVEYTLLSEKWMMPDNYYAFISKHVQFIGLDSTAIFWGFPESQEVWLPSQLAQEGPTWRIAFGHHTYLSNGNHGNAGEYDDIPQWLPSPAAIRGEHMQDFVEDQLCGKVDFYLAGHDHNRQWHSDTCAGTEFIVSGAGAKLTEDNNRGNPTHFEDYDKLGFLWVEISGDTLTGEFYDGDGQLESTQTRIR